VDGFHFDDSESDSDDPGFELAKWLMIIPGSNLHALWRTIYITSCLISPYFYAWISLHGHESFTEDKSTWVTVIVFESIFAANILICFITAYYPEG
jgi:hypothetical protein